MKVRGVDSEGEGCGRVKVWGVEGEGCEGCGGYG